MGSSVECRLERSTDGCGCVDAAVRLLIPMNCKTRRRVRQLPTVPFRSDDKTRGGRVEHRLLLSPTSKDFSKLQSLTVVELTAKRVRR